MATKHLKMLESEGNMEDKSKKYFNAIENALPSEMMFEHTNTEKKRREVWVIQSNGKIRPRDKVIDEGALKYHYWQQLMPGEIVVCWKYDDYGSAKKPFSSCDTATGSLRHPRSSASARSNIRASTSWRAQPEKDPTDGICSQKTT